MIRYAAVEPTCPAGIIKLAESKQQLLEILDLLNKEVWNGKANIVTHHPDPAVEIYHQGELVLAIAYQEVVIVDVNLYFFDPHGRPIFDSFFQCCEDELESVVRGHLPPAELTNLLSTWEESRHAPNEGVGRLLIGGQRLAEARFKPTEEPDASPE